MHTNISRLSMALVLSGSLISPSAMAVSCNEVANTPHAKVEALEQKKQTELAEKIVTLLQMDASLVDVLAQPEMMMYLYIRFFEKDADDRELSDTLAKMSIINGKTDLHDLFTKQIESKLKDPALEAQVRELFQAENFVEQRQAQKPTSKKGWLVKQIRALPQTIKRMKAIVKNDLAMPKMDRRLFDMYGALHFGWKESSLREWDKVPGSFAAIHPSQITNQDPIAWAHLAVFASEIEGGIDGYSRQSGEMFRAFLPNLSLFSGKTVEQAEFQDKGNRGFCSNVWCFEENRHTGMLRTVYRQLTGKTPPAENPSEAYHNLSPFNANDVLYHAISRNATEWNAISGYTMMGSHADGAAYGWIKNIREDEIKHMAIFSGAFKYVYGTQLGLRLTMMLKKIKTELSYESGKSQYGESSSTNPAIFLESMIAHLIVEKQVREYLRSIPFKTLDKIMNLTPGIELPGSHPVAADKQKQIDDMLARETQSHKNLARWTPKERSEVLDLKKFEQSYKNEKLVLALIDKAFGKFQGLEDYDSTESTATRRSLQKMSRGELASLATEKGLSADDRTQLSSLGNADFALLKRSLLETLRDYQIMNNDLVRAKQMKVVLNNLSKGYEILVP